MLIAATKNFAGIATIRFLMGIFESGIVPCSVHVVGIWYKRSEQAPRQIIWYLLVSIASLCGGLLSYGAGHIHSKTVEQWQWIVSCLAENM